MVGTKIVNFIQKNPGEVIIITFILILSLFLRGYRLPEYMTFLGDEGRDALVVKKILTEYDFPLLGPPTSVGNVYLGPLYYYMMSFAMGFSNLNPIAAAFMNVLTGTLTILLIYYLARIWFGVIPASLVSLLYSLSPVTITYSRSSWNPNPTPFFALLSILGLYLAHKRNNYYWLVLTGAALAFALQMHYLVLNLLPLVFIIWLIELKRGKKNNFNKGTILALGGFVFLMSPLAIYDFKYNFQNYLAFRDLFSSNQVVSFTNPLLSLNRIFPILNQKLIGRLMAGENTQLSILILFMVITPIITLIYRKINLKPLTWPQVVLPAWLIIGLIGLSFFKGPVYDHYLGFLNPAPYLLLGATLSSILSKKTLPLILTFIVIACLINLSKSPLLQPPNQQLLKTTKIAEEIVIRSKGKPFNFALIAHNNYDAAYRFILEKEGHKPYDLPAQRTEQLFVVCEDGECQPAVNPKYEIAAFGWSKIEQMEEIEGVKLYKLVENPEGRKFKKEI